MTRNATQGEQVREHIYYIDRFQLPAHLDRQAFARELVNDVVVRIEKLTPHCLTLNVTDRLAVPDGMRHLLSSCCGDGDGRASQHGNTLGTG